MLRSSLLAFVFGVWLLQQQPVLPPVFPLLLLAPAGWLAFRLRRYLAGNILITLVALAAGFFWAALVAEHRLADVLPGDWEGRDIVLIGVIAELPKPQERGERFMLDVEQVLTAGARVPGLVALTNYTPDGRQAWASPSVGRVHPGALAHDSQAQAASRHLQPQRLRF